MRDLAEMHFDVHNAQYVTFRITFPDLIVVDEIIYKFEDFVEL